MGWSSPPPRAGRWSSWAAAISSLSLGDRPKNRALFSGDIPRNGDLFWEVYEIIGLCLGDIPNSRYTKGRAFPWKVYPTVGHFSRDIPK